jgi:hypothetical protein
VLAVGNGPGVPGLNTQPALQAVISETHTFSPSAFNEARFGFTRLNLRSFNALTLGGTCQRRLASVART